MASSRPPDKEVGIIGLGKMGGNLVRRLSESGWRVVGFNRSPGKTRALEREGSRGFIGAYSPRELVGALSPPRAVWTMVPHEHLDELLLPGGLIAELEAGDAVIDGGNSHYKDSMRRSRELAGHGLRFIDVGVSGGPEGALRGASLMIGGEREVFELLEPLFQAIAAPHGYQFFEGSGAGHFVKMVHNGIEYGMMQALAEGFTLLRQAEFRLDLKRAADVYNHGSVIESRLVGWLEQAFELHGEALEGVSGSVGHTGEGAWTVEAAEERGVKAGVIEAALAFRVASAEDPSYTGQILSALREQFGGHRVTDRG